MLRKSWPAGALVVVIIGFGLVTLAPAASATATRAKPMEASQSVAAAKQRKVIGKYKTRVECERAGRTRFPRQPGRWSCDAREVGPSLLYYLYQER